MRSRGVVLETSKHHWNCREIEENMKIHHIGYAVNDISIAIKEFEKMGYSFSEIIRDDSRGVVISFGSNGPYCIELIAPGTDKSPVNNILGKIGPCPYHICYEIENIDEALGELRGKGYIQVSSISPAPAIENKKAVFLNNLTTGLIELLEY